MQLAPPPPAPQPLLSEPRRLPRRALEAGVAPPLLARQPLLGEPRRLPCRALEAGVAAPARAAARDRDLLAGADEVVARAVPALDLGARRHGDDQRVAVGPVHLLAEPVAAALGA